ncbi:MAG: DUF1064 domain-containing protein [bacterium]|nr:DUF1064 domain-containing protein [bacterium]
MSRSKFNVSSDKNRRTYNGIVFDSELEMKYYRDVLLPAVECGEIVEYELQKKYELQSKFKKDNKTIRAIDYIADFYIKYSSGEEVAIDIKGMPDSVAKLKRKMFWYKYPDINYKWICYSKIDGGWCDYEYVNQQRAIRKKNKDLKG